MNNICMITDFSVLNNGKWCVGPNGELASSKSNLISRYKTNPKTVERVMKKYNLDFNTALAWIEKNGKKRKSPIIKIGDKTYKTYDAAARHNCIDKERLAKLIKAGKNPTDAAAELICEKIVYTAPNGQKFEDTDAIAKVLGCSKKVVKKHLFSMAPQNGEEIRKKRTCKSTVPVEKRTYNGHVYESFSEMIRQCGVPGLSYEAYYYRVNKKGMTIEQALRTPVRNAGSAKPASKAPAQEIPFDINIKKNSTAAANVAPAAVKTVKTPAKKSKADAEARTFNGVVYDTIKNMVDACGDSGVVYNVYSHRISRGWSKEKALLTPKRPRSCWKKNSAGNADAPGENIESVKPAKKAGPSKKKARRSVIPVEERTFNDVVYPTIKAMVNACAVEAVTLNTYLQRIRAGWSKEKALLTPPARKK